MYFFQIIYVDSFTNLIQWIARYSSKNVWRKLCPFEPRAIPCKAKGALGFLYYFVLLIFYKAFSWDQKKKKKKKKGKKKKEKRKKRERETS